MFRKKNKKMNPVNEQNNEQSKLLKFHFLLFQSLFFLMLDLSLAKIVKRNVEHLPKDIHTKVVNNTLSMYGTSRLRRLIQSSVFTNLFIKIIRNWRRLSGLLES